MNVEFNLSNLIFLGIAASSGLWGLMKIIAIQYRNETKRELQEQFRILDITNRAQNAQISTRLDTLDATVKSDAGQWQRIERELLTMKADMPLNYVRREDYIRGQSVLEAKIDGLGTKVEKTLLRAMNPANYPSK